MNCIPDEIRRKASLVASIVALAAIGVMAPAEAAAWEFESCSSKMVSEIDTSVPQAMLMLDRSGSMQSGIQDGPGREGWWWHIQNNWYSNAWRDPAPPGSQCFNNGACYSIFSNQAPGTEPSWGYYDGYWGWARTFWYGGPGSLWETAVTETEAVFSGFDTANGPTIKFGLGTFSSNYNYGIPAPESNWARIWSEASAYTDAQTLMSTLDHPQQGGPVGLTSTGKAIEKMAASSTVANQNRSTAGILVTDGEPTAPCSEFTNRGTCRDLRPARKAAIRAACDHRQVASMYVIGFSSSTNTAFNDLLAAAGGTGTCTDRNGGPIDPCSANMAQLLEDRDQADIKVSCTGSYQADTGSEYRQALEQITSDIACTYPLDVLNTPDGKAPSDPAGARVYLDQCPSGPGTHTAYGSEFDSARSDASTTTRAPLGLPCTDECGVTYSQGEKITYDMPTTPGQTNTVRIRVADYLHDCQDTMSVAVHADNQPIGTWTGSGINDFQVLEFDFTPTGSRTFITIYQTSDAYCGSSNSCTGTCGEFADDLNMVIDWVKMKDPEAGCASGGLSYVAPGQSGNGWTYAEDRTKVKLVGQACSSVKARQHSAVTTQVACPCEQTPGGTCLAPEGAECPTGTWQCTADWNDVCVPDTGCDPDKFCADKTQHDVRFGQPNIQMVVDRSGSMSSRISGKTLWELARRVLADLAAWSYIGDGCGTGANSQNCDRLHLGLDFWSSGAVSKIAAGEDTRPQQIRDAFDDESPPSGGTQFHRAAELLRDEDNLQETDSSNFGLMVTDGYPDHQWTLRESAEILCNIRRRVNAPVTTYVVGFGENTDQQINSFVAAAGGTGSCCYGAGCDPSDPAEATDPCEMLDYEVVNRDAMINQFERELSSAQRAEWQSLYNYLSASKGRTRETVNHKIDLAYDLMRYWGLGNFSQSLRDRFKKTMAYGTQHKYSQSATWHGGSGLFPEQLSSFSHLYADRDDTTRLTNGLYCEGGIEAKTAAALKRRIIEIFEAVECAFPLSLLPDMTSAPENPEGTTVEIYLSNAQSMVSVPHVDNSAGQQQLVDELRAKGVNNAGRFGDDGWLFGNQSRTYVELTDDLCSEVQSRNITRVDTQVCKLCSKTGQPCDVPCEQGDAGCGPDGYLMGRCRVGVYQCVRGEDTCVQTRNPMPEICNGIDDDCDGKRGDLRENEEQWSAAQWNLQSRYNGDYNGLACFNRDVCACENGEPDDIHGSAADADEFLEHLRGQDADQKDGSANCYCGEGLSADATPAASMSREAESSDAPAPDPMADDGAACATMVSDAPSSWSPTWLIGLLLAAGVARRRHRG